LINESRIKIKCKIKIFYMKNYKIIIIIRFLFYKNIIIYLKKNKSTGRCHPIKLNKWSMRGNEDEVHCLYKQWNGS